MKQLGLSRIISIKKKKNPILLAFTGNFKV